MPRHNYSKLRSRMTSEQLRQADAAAKQAMADMVLAELRREAGLTQEDLATAMGIKQPAVSKLESQSDMQIRTLQRLVQALGGELEIIVHLPRADVRISQFAEPADS